MPRREDTESLFAASQSGSRDALTQLLARALPHLRSFVRLRMGDDLRGHESCDDVIQSVCGDLLEDLSAFEYRDEAGLRGWLRTAMVHKMRQHRRWLHADKRDVQREQALASEPGPQRGAATPLQHAVAGETAARLEREVAALAEPYREAVLLSRLAGLSHAQVAAAMDRSEDSVRNLVSRGLLMLAQRLAE